MHLQSLELFGFKSFADKTVFNFHEGITAIVGPNGCGKSNLLDAVRWVLGEQSAKSLRGGEMADVIFNGTDTRKPLGFAEVSLTLTDCSTDLGVDWHDVRVTRRVYRDGNSEYFLNKTVCRLRDIQTLFADTGVARSAYSMMEQGRIDLILSSKPEDRRAVFEEAAGITKYKNQKREALRKLEATEANLLRIGDIIKEVKRQIGSLQRQAGKARRYQALLADLQVLDTHHSRKKLDALETELRECRREIQDLSAKEQAGRAAVESREDQLAETRRVLEHTDREVADARTELEQLQSEIAGHRGRIEFNRQRHTEISELIERARNEIAGAEAKRNRHRGEMQEVSALVDKTARSLATQRAELARLTELSARLKTERQARETELQALLLTSSKTENRISTLEDELSGMMLRRDATNERVDELDSTLSKAHTARDKAHGEVAAAREGIEADQKNVTALFSAMQNVEENLRKLRKTLADTEQELIEIQRALAEKESRLDVLRQLNEEGEGLAQGSQALLKGLDDPARIQSALSGALVAQVEVDPKFVPAIEAILGRTLHTIVLRNSDLASKIISTLTEKKLGQTALFVSELGQHLPRPKQNSLPKDAISWAVDTVRTPEPLASLVAQLLAGVAVFADLDQAMKAKRKSPEIAAATLSGEFISVEGIIFGGAISDQKESLLARKNRVTTLEREHTVLVADRDKLRQKRDEIRDAVDKAGVDLQDAVEKHRAAELAQSTSGNRVTLLQRELTDAERNVDILLSEKNTLVQQVESADARISELRKELEETQKALAAQNERQKALERARLQALTEEEKTADELSSIRTGVATEQQRHDTLVAQKQPMTARETELAETIASRQTEIENFEKRLVTQAEETKSAEAAIREQDSRREEIKATLAMLTEERAKHLSELNSAENELRETRTSITELHDRRATRQVRESQLQMKIDNLAEHVQRRYHVDLRALVADNAAFEKTLRVQLKSAERMEGGAPATPVPSTTDIGGAELSAPDLEKIVTDLMQRLDNMGPVNLEAVQEYDELEERYRFLETQNNDLTASRRELLDVIARINSTTQTLFAETFAQVRVNFREMFAELFGGGRADLSLMDENDPLNCGIEISAKPPGKQLQCVSLLSGGERTMTAVALLFAIYMVRPSPFCILDELDAPLDESNINRFIRMLERFVSQSQFIIITHNKRTIAKADILYGVTMEERGVSKLVGMKLTERSSVEQPPITRGTVSSQPQFALAENGHTEKARVAAR